MKIRPLLSVVGVIVAGQNGYAQEAVVEGPGVMVGEGTVLHPNAGIETGFISNLFFEEADPNAVAVVRALADLSLASLSPQRLDQDFGAVEGVQPPKLDWRAGLSLKVEDYPLGTAEERSQRNIGVEAHLNAKVLPDRAVSFEFAESYSRQRRPLNFESNRNLVRDINQLNASVILRPGGRALSFAAGYQNLIDFFEADQSTFANRLQHTFGLRGEWQWLPITRLFLEGSYGFFGPLGTDTNKQTSTPIRGRIGLASALTERTTARLSGGYGQAIYAQGTNFAGPLGDVELGYRYSPLGRITARYVYDFQDSINSNFYAEHAFLATLDQQLGRLVLDGGLGLRLRSYRGIPMGIGGPERRDDMLADASARIRYVHKERYEVSATYNTVIDETDYRYMIDTYTDDPGFVRHEANLGFRVAF